MKKEQFLRQGFSTGTAAAAAAALALGQLLTGVSQSSVLVDLPPFKFSQLCTLDELTGLGTRQLCIASERYGLACSCLVQRNRLDADKLPVCLAASFWQPAEGSFAWALVHKDGGDDPDATHRAGIYAFAALSPFLPCGPGGKSKPVMQAVGDFSLTLYGGSGVGVVTLPGLPVPVGDPAINPVPRVQILVAVLKVLERLRRHVSVHILLCVDQGEIISKRTLNPRLGILGGISILGTQGTVKPYSHEAWKAAICQSLSVAKAQGLHCVAFSTGRRSERLLMKLYPDLKPIAFVQAADFASFSIMQAVHHGMSVIIWGCFVGKLLKVAQGLPYTHAHKQAVDLNFCFEFCALHGADLSLLIELRRLPTVRGIFTLLWEKSPVLHAKVLRVLCLRAFDVLTAWIKEAQAERSVEQHCSCSLSLHVFDHDEILLGSVVDGNYATGF